MGQFASEAINGAEDLVDFVGGGLKNQVVGASVGNFLSAEGFFEFSEA